MAMNEPCLRPIGVAHTPYAEPADAPHQGFAADEEAEIEIFASFADGLAGKEEVVRVTVLYWADRADRESLVGADGVGAFLRRTPHRPNPINVCVCSVVGVDGCRLTVRGLDAVDGSPVLDLKPTLQNER